MKTSEWVSTLPLKVRLIALISLVLIIIVCCFFIVNVKESMNKKSEQIASSAVIIQQKEGKINTLLAVIDSRDSANIELKAKNDVLDSKLKESERKRIDAFNKYSQELAKRQQLSDTNSYRLFLQLTGNSDFVGTKFDGAYTVPIESIKEATYTYAERDALRDVNAIQSRDIITLNEKANNLNRLLINSNKDKDDLSQALSISRSEKNDYQNQLDLTKKQLKQQKVITKATIVGAVVMVLLIII